MDGGCGGEVRSYCCCNGPHAGSLPRLAQRRTDAAEHDRARTRQICGSDLDVHRPTPFESAYPLETRFGLRLYRRAAERQLSKCRGGWKCDLRHEENPTFVALGGRGAANQGCSTGTGPVP